MCFSRDPREILDILLLLSRRGHSAGLHVPVVLAAARTATDVEPLAPTAASLDRLNTAPLLACTSPSSLLFREVQDCLWEPVELVPEKV